MAEGKDKIIFYKNWCTTFQKLTVEEAGNLIKHFCDYVTDLNPEPVDRMTELLFDPIKDTLKRDLKKWEQIAERNRNNGSKGGRPENPPEPKQTQNNPVGFSGKKNNPEKPVKVNVSVTGSVTGSGIVNETEKKKVNTTLLCSFSSKTELDNDIDRATFSFWELFKSNLLEVGINKTTLLDKATLEKWRVPVKLMMEKDSRTVAEFTEVFKFLKTNAFWKKNIQSTEKLREKFERLLVEARQKPESKKDKPLIEPHHAERIARNLRGE